MASRWILGVVSVAGVAAGFSVTAYAVEPPPGAHTSSSAQVEHLYRTEVALGTREQQLQFLLKLHATGPVAAAPAAAQSPNSALEAPTAAVASAPPQSPAAVTTNTPGAAAAPSVPASTATPTTTTSTVPPATTTTTTTPPTTTTTTERDSGDGSDDGSGSGDS